MEVSFLDRILNHFFRKSPLFLEIMAERHQYAAKCNTLEIDLTAAREAVDEEAEYRQRAEDLADALARDRDKLWDLARESLKGERYALQSQANILSQRSGAGVVYPDAHSINNPVLQQEGGPAGRQGRILPSQLAEQARQAAIAKIVERDIKPMFQKQA
jgi:hypothetical protein